MSDTDVRRWEYRTLRPPRDETQKEAEDPEAELNDYGEDGWELAATVEYTGGGTKYLVFKRPAGPAGGEDEARASSDGATVTGDEPTASTDEG